MNWVTLPDSQVIPLKHVAGINERALSEDTDPNFEFRYVDISAVGSGSLVEELELIRFGDAPSRARRLVAIGDTIVSTVRTYLRAVWSVNESADDLVVSTGFAVLTPRKVDPRYFSWWVRSDAFIEEVVARSVGVSYPAINALDLGDFPVRVPPREEQRAIADHLHREITHIDKRIELAQYRMETTTERLVAAIELAVLGREPIPCSGAPSGPLVPVPESWSMRPNKSFIRERSELSRSGTEELLSVSHLTGVTRRSEKNVTMFLADSNEGDKLVRSGDLVINTMWAWMGALGVSELEGIVSPAYGVYEFTDPEVDSRYFDALFRSAAYVCEMTRFSKGVWTSRLRLYPESFLSLRTPFPPVEQQRRIADQVRELRQEADRLLPLVKKELVLLRERRQALITAVVTGELEVAA